MRLFIQIRNGQPYEHPILEENFKQVFPHIDLNNLPPEFAVFERVENPRTAGVYQVDQVSYQWVDGVVKDVWSHRDMTDAEKIQAQNKVKAAWAEQPEAAWAQQTDIENLSNWVFDETVCAYRPPNILENTDV